MSPEHRFTEDEVRAIFDQAAQRQAEAHRAEEKSGAGLTLEELQRIGADAGIDPVHVIDAAEALRLRGTAEPDPPERTTLLGMPTHLRQTRYLPALPDDATWEHMVADLRRQFDTPGLAGELGRQREWTSVSGGRRQGAPVHVTLVPEGAGGRLTIAQTLRRTALPFALVSGAYSAVALVFGALLAAGALGDDGSFIVAMFAAMALLMFGGAQVGFRLYAQHQERRFDAALDRLERIARDATPESDATDTTALAGGTSLPAAPPLLELEGLPEPEEEPARRTPGRTRA